MSNYERVKQYVTSATIPEDDKKVIIDIFAEISDENLAEIADLFEKKGNWIQIFNDNRKKKIEAYASGDENAWQSILEEEKKYMNDLMFGLD